MLKLWFKSVIKCAKNKTLSWTLQEQGVQGSGVPTTRVSAPKLRGFCSPLGMVLGITSVVLCITFIFQYSLIRMLSFFKV